MIGGYRCYRLFELIMTYSEVWLVALMTFADSTMKADDQRVVAQLKNESGETLGSTFDLPLSVTAATLQQICNALLQQVIVILYLLNFC